MFTFALVYVHDGQLQPLLQGSMHVAALPGFLFAIVGLRRFLPGLRVSINGQLATAMIIRPQTAQVIGTTTDLY